MKLVSDRYWARNSHSHILGLMLVLPIPGIPFLHIYRGLDLAG